MHCRNQHSLALHLLIASLQKFLSTDYQGQEFITHQTSIVLCVPFKFSILVWVLGCLEMSIISVVTRSPIRLFIAKSGFKLNKKFREKFCLSPRKFGRSLDLNFRLSCLYILYIFTSPSAENKDKFVHLRRLFLPCCPVGYSLKKMIINSFIVLSAMQKSGAKHVTGCVFLAPKRRTPLSRRCLLHAVPAYAGLSRSRDRLNGAFE